MLKLYPAHTIAGLTVYEDDSNPAVFYVMPDEPSFRTDPKTGKLVLNFMKYKMPVNRPDHSVGGGFLIFDSVFVIDPAKLKQIQADRDQYLKDRFGTTAGTKPPT